MNSKNLSVIFDEVKQSSEMEYCEDFRVVQSSAKHMNEFVKNFSKILFRSGEF